MQIPVALNFEVSGQVGAFAVGYLVSHRKSIMENNNNTKPASAELSQRNCPSFKAPALTTWWWNGEDAFEFDRRKTGLGSNRLLVFSGVLLQIRRVGKMRWDYNDYYLLMQNQKSSIKSSQNFIISIPYLMSRPNHTYKANIGCTTQPLEADQFLKKDNSLFDPFQPTINQQDNTTSQKSADNCEQVGEKDREDQPQQCRKCNYNFNQESQCRNLPFEMSPPSGEDSPDEKYEQDNCSANQADKKRRRMGRKNVENADFEPKNVIQQDQNTSKRKTAKKITPDRPKNTHKNISCKCKKTHCIKSYCQCFLSNLGCNANCECLDCANWAQVPKSKKKMQSPTVEKKEQKSGHSCQCKKTNCVKNYCECYHSGTKCGQGCHCTDCHNKGV